MANKRADIVIFHKNSDEPYIIVEVKKPQRKDGIEQLKSYCNAEGSPIGVWTNGKQTEFWHREKPNNFISVSDIPTIYQTLEDVINEKWTIDKLNEKNKLVIERTSLKDIFLELDDLVWSNAKGIDDSFDEAFKLIYAKLYDECCAIIDPDRNRELQFRNYGEKEYILYKKINELFFRAKEEWQGVFNRDDKIKLRPALLKTCVSTLENVKLFSADLQVVDDAFEYLITDIAKGKKGQYFTPRWVIKMCVKMLNPTKNDKFLDPACGSSGFGVHTIRYMVPKNHSKPTLPPFVEKFAKNKVFNIDSSPRAVKVSKAVNIIIGDGKNHVFELDSLNPKDWEPDGKVGFRNFLTHFDDHNKREENEKTYNNMDFDVIMTNPPFAGAILEDKILKQYELARKNGKITKISRDILFIKRCLNFLRKGGRMAIVLPQGRLNNSSDFFIRDFLFDKARILAVVGLHGNTFKPHTGTKTSVVFLQKYNDEEQEKTKNILKRHEKGWKKFHQQLQELDKKEITKKDTPPILQTFLESYFSKSELDENESCEKGRINCEKNNEIEDGNELEEKIKELEGQYRNMSDHQKGKIALKRLIEDKKFDLASMSLKGQIGWLLSHEGVLSSFHDVWLQNKSAKDLDYPIFFAVSEKSGKENNGNLIYKMDSDGGLIIKDDFPVVDNDCDEIAEKFIEFAKKEKLDFWS